jgi:hypothetical protein
MKQLEPSVRRRPNVSVLLGQQKGNIAQIRLAKGDGSTGDLVFTGGIFTSQS